MYLIAITYTRHRFTDDCGGYEDDHGFEVENELWDADDIIRELDNGGFMHPSCSPISNDPKLSTGTWLSTEGEHENMTSDWIITKSFHMNDDKKSAQLFWHNMLKKCAI